MSRTTAQTAWRAGRFSGWLGRARRDPALRSAAFAFLLTRAVVLVVFVVGGQMNRVTEGDLKTTREVKLSLAKVPVARVLRETVLHADINWYRGIAEEGYARRPFTDEKPYNWAFFPLFPVVWREAARLTGEYAVTGVLLTHVFFFFALLFFYRAAREFGLDADAADRAVFYLAAFPTSYFFSLPLTESLFLLLTVASFYAGRRGRWWAAGLLGALASATRVTGVLLLPALAVLYLQRYGREWRRREALWLLLVPAGLFAFMLFLHAITGNAFAFRDVLVAWGRTPGLFVVPLWNYLSDPLLIASPWDFRLINFGAAALALVAGVVLLKRREWALGAYVLLCTLVALSSQLLQSQARYAMVLFPVFMVLATRAAARPRLDQTIRAVSLVLLTLLTALFVGRFTIAMS